MRTLVLALAALCAAACLAPSQHDPARFQPVRVAFGPALDTSINGPGPWRADELKELRAELLALNALGPDFVESSEGSADVVLRPFDSTQDAGGRKCGAGVGRYALGRDYAECDPACADGYDELRACAAHEIGHWLGMRHVAQHGERCDDCDTAVGTGDAIMNPRIGYALADGTPSELNDDDDIDVATTRPTALDIAEFNRARAEHRALR